MTRGAQCVTTTGTWWMPTWCVGSWAVGWLWRWAAALSLDKDQGSYCWTMWTAEEVRQTSASAEVWAGVSTTVTTMRMWVLPAEVQPLYNLKLAEVVANPFSVHFNFCFLFSYSPILLPEPAVVGAKGIEDLTTPPQENSALRKFCLLLSK